MTALGTCESCNEAQARLSHGYHAECHGCNVRIVARSTEYFFARCEHRITPEYKALRDKFKVTDAEVHAAYKADWLRKGPT